MKICSKCNINKLETEFYKNKGTTDGLTGKCKCCIKQYNSEHKVERKINQIRFKNNNPTYFYDYEKTEKRKEYIKKYITNDKIIILEKTCSNCNVIKPISDFPTNSNKKDGHQGYCKRCEIDKKKLYHKKRKEYDYKFKLISNIRCLVGNSIKKQGYSKKSKTYDILGCSYEEFKEYIESKFIEGMSWDNRTLWHLDHIYPVSLATNEEEIIKLNHYTNFQPLWAIDNIKKSNKIN